MIQDRADRLKQEAIDAREQARWLYRKASNLRNEASEEREKLTRLQNESIQYDFNHPFQVTSRINRAISMMQGERFIPVVLMGQRGFRNQTFS